MTEYGITWSGRKHIAGACNKYGITAAACNNMIDIYLPDDPDPFRDIPPHLHEVWDNEEAPMCKRCAKIEAAS
jgi:hypothetical protein